MAVFTSLIGMALLALRIAVPIYLYQQAKERNFPIPWLWIVFGIFEPIIALILFYVLVFFGPAVKR